MNHDNVEYFDDFLGEPFQNGGFSPYHFGQYGGGILTRENFEGGVISLFTYGGNEFHNAILRFGDSLPGGKCNLLQWNPSRGLCYRARGMLNTDSYIGCTFGFVGKDDPADVVAFVYWSNERDGKFALQVRSNDVGNQQRDGSIWTEFKPTPGRYFDVEIRIDPLTRLVSGFINNEPCGTTTNPLATPTDLLCVEHQIFNAKKKDNTWNQTTLYLDYWWARQKRAPLILPSPVPPLVA